MDVAAIAALQDVLARFGVDVAILFGSAAAGRLRPDSDVDIGVLFSQPVDTDALALELEQLLGREIDLVDLRAASTLLRHEAAAGRKLYQRHPGAFASFVARAQVEYDDLKPHLDRCGWGMMRKLAEHR